MRLNEISQTGNSFGHCLFIFQQSTFQKHATGCCKCFISLVCNLLYCGVFVCWHKGHQQAEHTRLKLSALSLQPRRRWSGTECWQNCWHPLLKTLDNLESCFCNRLIQPCCLKERYKKLFQPGAVRLRISSALARNLS